MPFGEGPGHGGLVDDRAAGDVDQDRALRQEFQLPLPDEAAGPLGERAGQHEGACRGEDVVQGGVSRAGGDAGDVVGAAGPAHADHLGAGRGQRGGDLAADATEADEHDAGAGQHRGFPRLPAVPGLGPAQAGHVLDVVEQAQEGELGERQTVHTGRGRENQIGLVQAGALQEAADARARALHPAQPRAVARHRGRVLPVEVEADHGADSEVGPAGQVILGQVAGRAAVVGRVLRDRQEVRLVDDLQPGVGRRDPGHILGLERRRDQDRYRARCHLTSPSARPRRVSRQHTHSPPPASPAATSAAHRPAELRPPGPSAPARNACRTSSARAVAAPRETPCRTPPARAIAARAKRPAELHPPGPSLPRAKRPAEFPPPRRPPCRRHAAQPGFHRPGRRDPRDTPSQK